jgi:glycosyltransferase involved in cell wall biosynthesis
VRLLFVADSRSPTAINWIRHFVEIGHEVHLVTTFANNPSLELSSVTHIPVAFSGLKRPEPSRGLGAALDGAGRIGLRTAIRQLLGPYTLSSSAKQLNTVARDVEPDLIHAMRIPFEGMMTIQARIASPVLLSVWGNDFTLHAPATPKMRSMTRKTLQQSAGLHVDCNRDLRLAHEWGYPADRPAIVLPGAGGIVPEIFHPVQTGEQHQTITIGGETIELPVESPVIVNPRGFRAYVRNDTFFRSIQFILENVQGAIFLCPAMKGVREAESLVKTLGIEKSVYLLPKLTAREMGDVYRSAQISVSPSEHDGTPNTLLESMASGCYPIAGDIESIREWIQNGVNGSLIDPSNPSELARAVLAALNNPDLLERARNTNIRMVVDRANRADVMHKAEDFYQIFRDLGS